jgi:hypothetical protein
VYIAKCALENRAYLQLAQRGRSDEILIPTVLRIGKAVKNHIRLFVSRARYCATCGCAGSCIGRGMTKIFVMFRDARREEAASVHRANKKSSHGLSLFVAKPFISPREREKTRVCKN